MRKKLANFGLSSVKRLDLMLVLLFLVAIPFLNHNQNVLGISTSSQNLQPTPTRVITPIPTKKPLPTPTPISICTNGILQTFQISTLCTNTTPNRYKTLNFTCGNGKKYTYQPVTINKDCYLVNDLYQAAKNKCAKECQNTLSPTPTPIIYCGSTKTCSPGYVCGQCTGAIIPGQPTPNPEKTCRCVKVLPTPTKKLEVTSTPTKSPTPTSIPKGCTPVTFSSVVSGNETIVKIQGAWWLSVTSSPKYTSVTNDVQQKIIYLHFSVSSGDVFIHTAGYDGAPLCQTYHFGNK